jgi:L-fuconolactonase
MTQIIDIHPHVISPDTASYPLTPLGGKQSSWSKHPLTHEGLVQAMDAAGVAKAVVVQASTAYGFNNTYLAEAIAAHPDRLTGVCAVDVLADDAIERLEYWRTRGMVGWRLFTTGTTMPGQADWLDDPRSFPVWEHAAAQGLPVCVQMQQAGIPALRNLLDRFPTARVVIDHCARAPLADGPPYAGAAGLFALAAYPGVHLKLTHRNLEAAAEAPGGVAAFIAQLVGTFGAGRIAWGSNYPAAERPLGTLLALVQDALAPLPAADRAMILSGTAQSLYPVLTRI